MVQNLLKVTQFLHKIPGAMDHSAEDKLHQERPGAVGLEDRNRPGEANRPNLTCGMAGMHHVQQPLQQQTLQYNVLTLTTSCQIRQISRKKCPNDLHDYLGTPLLFQRHRSTMLEQ